MRRLDTVQDIQDEINDQNSRLPAFERTLRDLRKKRLLYLKDPVEYTSVMTEIRTIENKISAINGTVKQLRSKIRFLVKGQK